MKCGWVVKRRNRVTRCPNKATSINIDGESIYLCATHKVVVESMLARRDRLLKKLLQAIRGEDKLVP